MSDRSVVQRHFKALLAEAASAHIPSDVVGRMLLDEVLAVWREQRSLEDIAAELRYTIENLDPDMEYAFFRP
jgi:hypothetical protein